MSGLLHRLADRAAGRAPRVRSNAALPYAAEALDWTGGTEAAPLSAPAPAHRDAAVAPHPPPEAARPMPDAAIPLRATEHRANAAETARAPAATEAPAAQPPPAAAAEPAAVQRIETSEPRAPRLLVRPARHPTTEADEGSPGPAEPIPAAVAPPPVPPPLRRSMPGEPVAPAAATGVPPTRFPPPRRLMPAAPVTVELGGMGTTASGSAAPRASAGGRAGETANEVHVHIGRIEVTAVREPAARRSKPAPAPLQSLDAYLATRSRR